MPFSSLRRTGAVEILYPWISEGELSTLWISPRELHGSVDLASPNAGQSPELSPLRAISRYRQPSHPAHQHAPGPPVHGESQRWPHRPGAGWNRSIAS